MVDFNIYSPFSLGFDETFSRLELLRELEQTIHRTMLLTDVMVEPLWKSLLLDFQAKISEWRQNEMF